MQREQSEPSDTREVQGNWTARRGQILVMFAAGIFLLVGMVALAIDAGFLMAERRQVQNAADAGALAAAKAKLDYMHDPDSESIQTETGKQYAARNAGVSQDNVDVDPDPAMDGVDDVYIEDSINRYIEVGVSKDVTSFFLGALYDGDWSTNATAIAGIEPVPRPYALLALDCGPGANGGIDVSGSGTITVQQGSIMSNCGITTSGSAGGSEVIANVAIDAHGTIEAGPDWCGGDDCTEINENRPQVSDPVAEAGIQPPSEGAARAVREVIDDASIRDAITNLTEANSNPHRCPQGSTCVMQPGYYGGDLTGISVRGTLQMEPGIYYFDDDFVIDGHSENTIILGSEVLLYFTGNSAFQPKHATIELSAAGAVGGGGCEATLDAIVIWIENGSPFRMQSNGIFKIDGVIYAPDSDVRLYGGPYASSMQVIVKSLELSGGNDFNIEFLDCFDGETPYVFLVK